MIKTSLSGKLLLNTPQINKDTAFTQEERLSLGLLGLLPDKVETLDEQVQRTYFQLQNHNTRLRKYIFLSDLLDKNYVLFYKLLETYLGELLPIIYTPTVGTAVKTFSQKFRRPRGVYLSYENRAHLKDIFNNISNDQIDVIVVTDGEGVLGIGDQGIGAMDIPIAKLVVYTLMGGINPDRTLPIMLDVGTNNETLLSNPMYLGWRNRRLCGKEYDDFIQLFVDTVRERFPHVFLHWEDFGRDNAQRILEKYQHKICTFNDDMQGTGIVALATILAATHAKKEKLEDQRIVIFGAGTAGIGIAERIKDAIIQNGLSEEEAKKCFWLIDRCGLITHESQYTTIPQQQFARHAHEVQTWSHTNLETVVKHVKPTILIGCSSVGDAFTRSIIEEMARHVDRPLIMPLSNPTKNAEATPQQLLDWTEGKAFIATGSPFLPCEYKGEKIIISQCNNALIFPALGLGITAVQATRLTNNMIRAAAQALSKFSPLNQGTGDLLLPPITSTRSFSAEIAFAIAKQAVKEGYCEDYPDETIWEKIKAIQWKAEYVPIISTR